MQQSSQRPLVLSEDWLERLGIGLLVIHGRTVIRATAAAQRLLERGALQTVGRDFTQLLGATHATRLRAWVELIHEDATQTEPLLIDSAPAGDQPPRRLRLTAGPAEGSSASTRMIAIEAVPPAQLPAPQAPTLQHDAIADLRRTLNELLDGNPVPTFVLGTDHVVMHWNKACEKITGVPASEAIGTRRAWHPVYTESRPVLADFIIDADRIADARALYGDTLRNSDVIDGALEMSAFFSSLGDEGRWLLCTAAPIRNAQGALIGAIETMVDISEIKRAEASLLESQSQLEELVRKRTTQLEAAKRELEEDVEHRRQAESGLLAQYAELMALNYQLSEANERLQAAQNQLVQSEKLASIGQLAAGVAHEINNPIGYVFSNFGTLETYLADLLQLIDAYTRAEHHISDSEMRQALADIRQRLDLDFLRQDALALMHESREGIERVRKIVQDLKDFSHVDRELDWQWADLHRGLESTLNIAHNEIKYRADVVREFGQLPQIECLPSQLNQVFMNLLVNAAHAMEGRPHGTITVRTACNEHEVWVEVQDTGCGMGPETLGKIFDPFFTTKPIGTGTGLGLSLSYGIVRKHHGRIEVDSTPDVGTCFRVVLPIQQPTAAGDAEPRDLPSQP